MSSVRFAWRHLLYCLIGACALVPAAASAQLAQEKVFYDTLLAKCNSVSMVTDPLFQVCNKVLSGGLSTGVYTPGITVANLGSTGSYSSTEQVGLQREFDDLLGDEEAKKRKKIGGGSGDFTAGPFGGFVTAQTSRTTRDPTDLENGYKAKLNGLLTGLDRRFGNNLVIGASLGRSHTDSNYMDDAGTMNARNTTLMLYSTYLPRPVLTWAATSAAVGAL